jgi:hypothetical protein
MRKVAGIARSPHPKDALIPSLHEQGRPSALLPVHAAQESSMTRGEVSSLLLSRQAVQLGHPVLNDAANQE